MSSRPATAAWTASATTTTSSPVTPCNAPSANVLCVGATDSNDQADRVLELRAQHRRPVRARQRHRVGVDGSRGAVHVRRRARRWPRRTSPACSHCSEPTIRPRQPSALRAATLDVGRPARRADRHVGQRRPPERRRGARGATRHARRHTGTSGARINSVRTGEASGRQADIAARGDTSNGAREAAGDLQRLARRHGDVHDPAARMRRRARTRDRTVHQDRGPGPAFVRADEPSRRLRAEAGPVRAPRRGRTRQPPGAVHRSPLTARARER